MRCTDGETVEDKASKLVSLPIPPDEFANVFARGSVPLSGDLRFNERLEVVGNGDVHRGHRMIDDGKVWQGREGVPSSRAVGECARGGAQRREGRRGSPTRRTRLVPKRALASGGRAPPPFNGVEMMGIEPTTSSMRTKRSAK